MRTPTLISIACALALGACGSHSLTGDNSGSGGAGTGGAGTGGAGTGARSSTGGSMGTMQAFCSSLEAGYQSALGAAKLCDVGTTASCAQQVSSSLSGCGSCPTFVTDASKLTTIQQTYDQAGCQKLLALPCIDGACPVANNNACVSIDGGSQGTCSYVPGSPGTGGASGAGGSPGTGGASGDAGVESCSDLAAQYRAALAAAKSCDPGAANQCASIVSSTLSPCSSGCVDYVNDASTLDVISRRWQAIGCGATTVACPALACLKPVGSLCTASDAGGGTCVAAYPVGATAP